MIELYAKSKPKRDDVEWPTLAKHLSDVVETGGYLFGTDSPTRLCRKWFDFFKLDTGLSPRFISTLRAAAALHDLGKANDGFQEAICEKGEQAIRHEHLSALMMHHEPVWKWLLQDQSVDWPIVLSAVVTHHQKCVDKSAIASLRPTRKIVKILANPKLREHIGQLMGQDQGLPGGEEYWTFDPNLRGRKIPDATMRLDEELDNLDRDLRQETAVQRRRLHRAVRAALICSDAAASGLRRENLSLAEWIEEQFDDSALCDAEYVEQNVIEKRINDLRSRGKWVEWHTFQTAAAAQPSRTLLLAPCGAGKTLAAWKWIAEQAKLCPVKRIIFLYPTRATATEGFKDYVAWAPGADASLNHGTGAYELDGMFTNPDDDRKGKDFGRDPRLFAVGYWSKRVFSATVDQFLAFLHHAYGPTCLLPVLVDSIVVIDEVHSFDLSMFGSLKAFLQEFNVPVLCMTATMLKTQRHQLETQCEMKVYEDRPDDLAKIADASRYRIQFESRESIDDIVAKALDGNKRILWVVNQVARAQEIAGKFGTVSIEDKRFTTKGIPVLCYHSRFTLDDRKDRHQAVVDEFKREGKRAILAVTTQVCEMSLDLDADILITELCPVTSLVQRMGRCNRKPYVPEDIGLVHVYPPKNKRGEEDEKPYEKDDIRSAKNFIDELAKLEVASQADLEQYLQKHGRKVAMDDRNVPFVSCDPYADSRNDPFRDIDERSDQGVLDEAAYVATERVKRPGLIVPVPRKFQPQRCTHKDARYLVLAPARHYDPALGLCDQPIGGQP